MINHLDSCRLLPIGILLAINTYVIPSCLMAAEPLLAAQSAIGGQTQRAGAIEGTVTYRGDPKRPWRYVRYYVKDRKQGQLAEAVVALKGSNREKGSSRDAPATIVVDQKNFQFVPETVAIQVGDRVKFLNSDKEVHNVQTSHPSHSFNVNMLSGREHVETFQRGGGTRRPYRIGCGYHSAMRAWIFVFDHPFFQLTSPDGRFQLKNIPPGEYELEMTHSAGQLRWSKKIEVEAGETTTIDIRVSPDDLPRERTG